MKPRIVAVTRTKYGRRAPVRIWREQVEKEARSSFVIEFLFFAILVAISAWPMIQAAEALQLL